MAGRKNQDELDAQPVTSGATHIRLVGGYRGKLTSEQFIPAGMYKRDDLSLFGLAEYLVENGHAVWETPSQPEPQPKVITKGVEEIEETEVTAPRRGRPRLSEE